MSYIRRWYDTFSTDLFLEQLVVRTPEEGGAYTMLSTSGNPQHGTLGDVDRLQAGSTGATWTIHWALGTTPANISDGRILSQIRFPSFRSGTESGTLHFRSCMVGGNFYDLRVLNNTGTGTNNLQLWRNGVSVATGTFVCTVDVNFELEWTWTPGGVHTVRVNGAAAAISYTDSSPLATGGIGLGFSGTSDTGPVVQVDDLQVFEFVSSTAPTLSVPTAGTPGSTSITISATTDLPSDGTMRFLRRVGGSAASAATIASTGESQAATANPQSRTMTGFTAASTNNFVDIVQVGAGGNSNVVSVGPFTMAGAAATTVTLSGPSSGANNTASTNFTVGANGTITGTVTVTPNAGGGGGSFTPTSVAISNGTPTATFTYTPTSTGAKTISVNNNGSLTNPSSITYTVSSAGTFTSDVLKRNNGTVVASEALNYVALYDNTTGALVVRQTGLSTNSSGIFAVVSASIVPGTTYKVDWETASGQRRMPTKAAT